jgi:Na+/H+-dicarboxylate symporter
VIKRVAIIGAGFSGTLQAINLLRHDGPGAVLIERAGEAGKGVAYGAAHPSHLLNVRAGNMSAFPDDPAHFVRWLEGRGVTDAAAAFVPRVTYGDYLGELLADARRAGAERLELVIGNVVDASVADAVELRFADGGLIPVNFLGLTAATTQADANLSTTLSFNVLQIIVAAIALGTAAVRVGAAGEPFLAFNGSALVIFRRLLRWVIALTPIGTAGLIGDAAVRYGWGALSTLGAFAGAVYLGLALVLLVVYPLILIGHGLSPLRFFASAWPAIQLGFVSRSSVGTLPLTEEVTEHALGVPRAYTAFAVPLGATTKMDGCAAIYPAVSAIFVAQFFGLALHPVDYALIVFVSVFGSAATAGLTGATVMLTLTLSTLGLPLDGVGLLLAIDPILDMGRTAVNVAGQALVPTIVAKRAGILDLARYARGLSQSDVSSEVAPAVA